MISKLENKIAFRYLKTRKKDGFLNVISIFSFIGISLGVAVLIIVMSVMNGFRSELVNKILGFNSHIIIQSYGENIDENIKNKLSELSNKSFLSSSGEVVLINKNFTKGLSVRGYRSDELNYLPFFEKQNINKKKNSRRKNNSYRKRT